MQKFRGLIKKGADINRLDLQTKVILVLIAVILPLFGFVTAFETLFVSPFLENELQQQGRNTAQALAAQVLSRRIHLNTKPKEPLEQMIQEYLYSQPNISRIDVFLKNSQVGEQNDWLASSIDEPEENAPIILPLPSTRTLEAWKDENGNRHWIVYEPIESLSRDQKKPHKNYGVVRVVLSVQFVERIVSTMQRLTVSAALLSVILLIAFLSYFLRKTIENERKLDAAQKQNLQLSGRLAETQRQLMTAEKLAVMGQLTASVAHEIGTPLGAMSGHLQLLKEDLNYFKFQDPLHKKAQHHAHERIDIIASQLDKIEKTVSGFLQTTAQPTTQKQLTDINQLIQQALKLIQPQANRLHIELVSKLDSDIAPARVVPVEIEQVLINLLNNALDSLKRDTLNPEIAPTTKKRVLEVSTADRTKTKVLVQILDTGQGISKANLSQVLKPFFTTKAPGEGTGLGLAICQEIIKKHGGDFQIESKEKYWTKVTFWLPYEATT